MPVLIAGNERREPQTKKVQDKIERQKVQGTSRTR